MGIVTSLLFILLFTFVNAFLWGNGGDVIHLLGYPVPAYGLVWAWIGMIAITCGANYAVDGGQKHPIGHVISLWWVANIGMTSILNNISYRGIEEAGNLHLDFIAQGGLDFASLLLIWFLVYRGTLTASLWIVVFSGYLLANLFGHTMGAYNLMMGAGEGFTAQAYDSYMYLTFTIMLLVQAVGAGSDGLLRWLGSNVDIYRDIRPAFHQFAHRYLRFP